MSMFDPVEVPVTGTDPTPENIRSSIDAWVSSNALHAIVDEVGKGVVPIGVPVEEKLRYLDEFTAENWNFRLNHQLERNQIDENAISGKSEEKVLEAASALGMRTPRAPRRREYDYIVVLGGLVRANVSRPAYAAHLIKQGISCVSVVGLSGYRELATNKEDESKDEPTLLRKFELPPREFEWEVLQDGMKRAFSSEPFRVVAESGHDVGPEGKWSHRQASSPSALLTLVVAPPPDDSGGRANTASTYAHWAKELAGLHAESHVLAVTTCHYVHFQHANAIENLALPTGCSVETVGIDNDAIPEAVVVPQVFRGVHYVLEVRSAIKSYIKLLAALDKK